MLIFKKLQQIKEVIKQQVVYQIILISKKNNKLIAIEFRKQQTLDADPKLMQQSNFTENLEQVENTTIFCC